MHGHLRGIGEFVRVIKCFGVSRNFVSPGIICGYRKQWAKLEIIGKVNQIYVKILCFI